MTNIYEIHAEICKVFSNPTRLEILNLLREKEMTVTALMKKTGLSQVNISQHLAIMKYKGIVTARRDGKNIHYKITYPRIIKAFDIIREVLTERLKENRQMITNLQEKK